MGWLFHESESEEWDLSDGEVWDCVTKFWATKRCQNFWTSSHNFEKMIPKFRFAKSRFCLKITVWTKFVNEQINITSKVWKKQINLINFEQILEMSIFQILFPEFFKIHVFKIFTNLIKIVSNVIKKNIFSSKFLKTIPDHYLQLRNFVFTISRCIWCGRIFIRCE